MRTSARLAAVFLLAAVLSAMHVELQAAAAGKPKCFGAASRDSERPCVNPNLALKVTPSPRAALEEANAPCVQIRLEVPDICAFGASPKNAKATVALIGDSHAVHWRSALAVIANRRLWRGLSIARPSCPFTLVKSESADQCRGWVRAVVRWLEAHPEVHTLFISANANSPVVTGESDKAARVSGFIDAWKKLPSSVREIYVIRDTPDSTSATRRCVERAVRRHRDAGLRCGFPRSVALRTDFQAVAAQSAGLARVKLIDLTPFMCAQAKCYPVIGGVLVVKDPSHLTRTFSSTLGPYLNRAISRLQGAA